MSDGIKVEDIYVLLGYRMDERSKKVLDDEKAKTEDELEKWADDTSGMLGDVFKINFFSDLYEGIKDVTVGLLNELSPQALLARADEWTALHDEINKTSKDIGLSGEAWQEWQFIARRTGTDVDELRNSFNKIGIELGNAANGDKSKLALFKSLGLDVQELLALDPAARLERVTAALRAIPEDTKRLQIGAKLFGEDALRKMTRLLNASGQEIQALKAEARGLGIVPQEALDQASKFQDTMANLRQVTDASASTFLLRYLPALDELLVEFTELWRVARPFIDGSISGPIDLIAASIRGAAFVVRTLRGWIEEIPEDVIAVSDAFGGWTNASRALLGVVLALGGAVAVLLAPAGMAKVGAMLARAGSFLAPLLGLGAAPIAAIAIALLALFAVANDVYTFFNSEDASQSIFARIFGLDPKVAADVEKGKRIAMTLLQIFNPLLILPIAIMRNWDKARVFLSGLVAFMVDSLKGLVEWVGEAFGVAPQEIYALLEQGKEGALSLFRDLFDLGMQLYELFGEGLFFVFKAVLTLLAVGFLSIVGLVAAFLVGMVKIGELIGALWERVKSFKGALSSFFSELGEGIIYVFEIASEKLSEMLAIASAFLDRIGGIGGGGDISTRLLAELAPNAARGGPLPANRQLTKTVSVGNGDRNIVIQAMDRTIEEVKEEFDESFFGVDTDFISSFLDDEEDL